MSVECGHFHDVEPATLGWNTDDQTDSLDSIPATGNPQHTGHVATGRAGSEPASQTQGQGQVPDDGEQLSRITPDTRSADNSDNTGDVA